MALDSGMEDGYNGGLIPKYTQREYDALKSNYEHYKTAAIVTFESLSDDNIFLRDESRGIGG